MYKRKELRKYYQKNQNQKNEITRELEHLKELRNIKKKSLSECEKEVAKYGTIGIPPRLNRAVEDLEQEIKEMDDYIKNLTKQIK